MGIVEDYLALQGKCNDALDSAEMWERKWRKAEADLAASQATVKTLWWCWAMYRDGRTDSMDFKGASDAIDNKDADALEAALGVGEE